ncbi:MAG: nucleotidyltransferase family protein [Desulfuromonadales bacterium]|nr:nucleotidyltransferase family protein [Desulfuromonadales bacterium]
MKKNEILTIIKQYKPELQSRFAVNRLGLFGSCVQNQQKPLSDIDLLVSFSHEIDLFDYIELRDYLEKLLPGKIDLVMESALKPEIGKRILAEVEYV